MGISRGLHLAYFFIQLNNYGKPFRAHTSSRHFVEQLIRLGHGYNTWGRDGDEMRILSMFSHYARSLDILVAAIWGSDHDVTHEHMGVDVDTGFVSTMASFLECRNPPIADAFSQEECHPWFHGTVFPGSRWGEARNIQEWPGMSSSLRLTSALCNEEGDGWYFLWLRWHTVKF